MKNEACLEATPHDAVHGNVWRARLPLTTRPYEDSEVVARLTVRLRLYTPFPPSLGQGWVYVSDKNG